MQLNHGNKSFISTHLFYMYVKLPCVDWAYCCLFFLLQIPWNARFQGVFSLNLSYFFSDTDRGTLWIPDRKTILTSIRVQIKAIQLNRTALLGKNPDKNQSVSQWEPQQYSFGLLTAILQAATRPIPRQETLFQN